jgi:hypothetical protein
MVPAEELLRDQAILQAEAEEVYRDLGLGTHLAAIGRPVGVGSAALGLMVRRDLDVTTACPALDPSTVRAVAELGARLAQHPRVRSVRIRDDTGHWNTDPDYPDGMYLGVEYRATAGHDWTLDLWFVDEPDRQPDLAHARDLPPRLDDTTRAAILAIKQARTGVPGIDVYRAVLDAGVRNPEDFDRWQTSNT